MKEVFLQFPSAESLGVFTHIIDFSNCEINSKQFTLIAQLRTADIELALKVFDAALAEHKPA